MKLIDAVKQSLLAWIRLNRDAKAVQVLTIQEGFSLSGGPLTSIYYSHSDPTREVRIIHRDLTLSGLLHIIDLELAEES